MTNLSNPPVVSPKEHSEGQHPEWLVLSLICICLIAFNTLLHISYLSLGFITDDYVVLADFQNNSFKLFGEWIKDLGYYRPFAKLLLYLQFAFFKSNPLPYHLVNLTVHSLTVCFLLLVLWKITAQRTVYRSRYSPSFLVWCIVPALFVMLHPTTDRNVAWISGQGDLLAGFFSVLSFYAYLMFEQYRQTKINLASAIFFGLAVASKESALGLPLLMFLYALINSRELKVQMTSFELVRVSIERVFPHLFILIGYLGVRFVFTGPEPVRPDFMSIIILIIKPWFHLFIPIAPLKFYQMLATHWIVVAGFIVFCSLVLGGLIFSAFHFVGRELLKVLGWIAAAVYLACLPLYFRGVIVERTMYLPLLMGLVFAVRLLLPFVRNKNLIWAVVSLAVFEFATLLFLHPATLNEYARASSLERKLAREIASQLDNPGHPIAILLYPYRVNQTDILWFLPYRMYFEIFRSFGKLENVRSGLRIISSDFNDGSHIQLSLSEVMRGEFQIRSSSDYQWIEVERAGLRPLSEVEILDYKGRTSQNALLEAHTLKVSKIGKSQVMKVKVLDKEFFSKSQLFVFVNGRMERIQ